MGVSCRTERSLLNHEDFELVSKTHSPAIYELTRSELEDARKRLRSLRDREFSLGRKKRLEARGKGEPRGASFTGTSDYPMRRKQVFASALKRTNREFNRLSKIEAQKTLTHSAQRALALRRAGDEFRRPEQGLAGNEGLRSNPSKRRRKHVQGGRVGSVTKATQRKQAIRDGR